MTAEQDQSCNALSALQAIVGVEHVLVGQAAERWSTDWTGAYRAMPIAVVRPDSRDEVSAIVRLANTFRIPLVPVSGNTGLNGGAIGRDAIIISVDRMRRIREIRPQARVAVVEAGVIVSALDDAVGQYGLTFPLSFGAAGSSLIGGVLSTNAGGANVLRYGNARDLCLGLEVVLPDGQVLDLMTTLKKDNSGFDLRDLLIGSEGQLGIITAAVLRLHPRAGEQVTAILGMQDLSRAPALLNRLQDASGGAVTAFEFMSRSYMEKVQGHVQGARCFLETIYPATILVEMSTTREMDLGSLLETGLEEAMETGDVSDAVVAQNNGQQRDMWALREAAAEVAFHRHPVVDTDIAVPVDRVADYLEAIPQRMAEIDAGFDDIAVAHLGDGNIHYTVWPSCDDPAIEAAFRAAIDALAVEMGGTFSAEHGIGLSKLPSMARHKNRVALDVMRKIKTALDPNGILNPGKTLPAEI